MDVQQRIKQQVESHPVVLFMKGTAQFSPMRVLRQRRAGVESPAGVKELHTGQRARGPGHPRRHRS